MNELEDIKIAVHSFIMSIAEIAHYNIESFNLNVCVALNENVVVANIGNKKTTITNETKTVIGNNLINKISIDKTEKHLMLENKDDYFHNYFLSCYFNSSLSESTKKNYYSTYLYLKEFNKNKNIKDVDYKYILEFEQFLFGYKLSINTIAKHMKHIKKIINSAIKMNDYQANNYPFRNYHIKEERVIKQHLNYNELSLLENFLIKNKETLGIWEQEISEAFLLSCYTGLRYSDIKSLHASEIQTINRQRWIIKKMQKTGNEVRIPLQSLFGAKPLHIIRSKRRTRGLIFRLQDNCKTNRILKHICKKAGIKKNISFHCGRHTAATLLLFDGVNITTVQKILGHKSVKQTEVYSAITDMTILNELKRVKRYKCK